MSPTLLKDTAGSVTAYLSRASDGSAHPGLTTSDLQVDIKKVGGSFNSLALVDPASATADIGSGADGTVTTTIDTAGEGGNDWTIEVKVPAGTSPLNVTVTGPDIVVELSVNGGVPVNGDNTAAQVATAIDTEPGISATASGTGVDPLTSVEGPVSFTGGVDGNFTDFGGGFYEVDLSATDTDTEGSLDIRFTGPTIQTNLISAFVQDSGAATPTATQPPPLTSLFGFIYSSSGEPIYGASVSARVLSQPTLLHPDEEGMAISRRLVTAKTGSDGFFSISLIAGSQIDIFIPSVNYRRTITVPSSTTNLFSIP